MDLLILMFSFSLTLLLVPIVAEAGSVHRKWVLGHISRVWSWPLLLPSTPLAYRAEMTEQASSSGGELRRAKAAAVLCGSCAHHDQCISACESW